MIGEFDDDEFDARTLIHANGSTIPIPD